MGEEQRVRFLNDLDDSLPMPLERRAEVIEEINAHLDDAVAAHVERGGSLDDAEARAQARLGPPHLLAADLARPEQSMWRLLAGVGAGVRTGIGQWIYGFLLGWLVLLLGVYGLVAVVQVSDELLGTGWSFEFTDQGWNTLITSGAIAFGLYHAGRAIPRAVSIASRRRAAELRPWVAAIGTAIAFLLLVFVIEMPQNWASAVGMVVAPLAFTMGVFRPSIVSSRMPSYLFFIGALVIVPALALLMVVQGSGGTTDAVDGTQSDRGLAMVGPWWADPMTSDEPLLWSIRLGDPRGAGEPYQWELNGDTALAGLRYLRVEAWHVSTIISPRLDARHRVPFAVATIERDGRKLTAALDTSSTPGVTNWELIVTGVGPDGTRYILDAGTILSSTFTGSAWDWLTAVAPIR